MIKKVIDILLKAVLALVLFGLVYLALVVIAVYTYGLGVFVVVGLAAAWLACWLASRCAATLRASD